MTDAELKKLSYRLRTKAPNVAQHGEGASSRREGEYAATESSRKGYSDVIAYAEAGLAPYRDVMLEILTCAWKVQRGFGVRYSTSVFAFGHEPGKLSHGPRATWNGTPRQWTDELCQLSGSTPPSADAVVPRLFPARPMAPAGAKRGISGADLLIFFCRNRAVELHPDAMAAYTPKVARHTIWVFLDGPKPEMVWESFVPAVASGGVAPSVPAPAEEAAGA